MSAPSSSTTIASLLPLLLLMAAGPTAVGASHAWERAEVGPWSPNLFDGGGASSRNPHNSRMKADRIIGGNNAPSGRYPYSVSLQRGGHFCGGSLIATDVVLTAAHCMGGSFTVRVGSDSTKQGPKIPVKRTYDHPRYDEDTDEFDVALVFLERSADGIRPDQLVRVNSNENFPPEGGEVLAMGWGDTDPSDDTSKYPSRQQSVALRTISNKECDGAKKGGESYKGYIFDSMLCTWTNGKDACQGDSGGPLVVTGNSPAEDVLVGITSWGIGCAFMPGVFSRTSEAYGWIEEQVCKRSQDPPPGICGGGETDEPTRRPTRNPTRNPTRSPTERPTRRPTRRPTKRPTYSPTLSPTTAEPTISPTETPSDSPSTSSAPTGSPSASPTVSSAPTSQPSDAPTVSTAPTAAPSGSPTASSRPSSQPSASPTSQPSGSPTASSQPSSQPSASPTSAPSGSPTSRPSSQPSSQPSWQPSLRPSTSSRPSSRPSAEPTGRPSASPSSSPTTSASPTSHPSTAPSWAPSDPPTATTAPTVSGAPTSSPAPTASLKTPFLDFGDALLAANQARSGNIVDEVQNSSGGMGLGRSVGALLCSAVAVWMVL